MRKQHRAKIDAKAPVSVTSLNGETGTECVQNAANPQNGVLLPSESGEKAARRPSSPARASVLPQSVAAAASSESTETRNPPKEHGKLGVRHMADTETAECRNPAKEHGKLGFRHVAESEATGEVVQASETAKAANQEGKSVTASVPRVSNGTGAKGKPGPRGPNMDSRKSYLRLTGTWIRKTHLDWKDEPSTPGRVQAMAVLLRTGASILEGRESDEEREEAERLFKLLQEHRALGPGKIGHA